MKNAKTLTINSQTEVNNMKTKNLLIIILAVLAISLMSSSVALAGGWHKIGPTEGNATNTFDPNAGLWSNISGGDADRVPHLNLQTSSNKCRTCHAVHNSDNTAKNMGDSGNTTGTGNSFKLLRNETRATECNFCHGPNGALSDPVKKPYGDMLDTGNVPIAAKGQHTLGAKIIPDSTVPTSSNSIFSDGLSCGNCHSVHGGWTLNGITEAGILSTRLLRRDPANNGNGTNGQGAGGGVINVADPGSGKAVLGAVDGTFTEGQYLAAFCGDCHNKNVSWDRGGSGSEGDSVSTASEGERPNKAAHPLGSTDGLIDVYGRLGRVEDATIANWIKGKDAGGSNIAGAHVDNVLACDDCHKSRRQQSELAATDPATANVPVDVTQYGKSKFPHQSVGHKLLSDSFNDTSTNLDAALGAGYAGDPTPLTNGYTGDPNRVLPNLDAKVCRTCHGDVGGTFKGVGNAGEVNTF